MTSSQIERRRGRYHTWVEVQRDRLERSSNRGPGTLAPEDGVGALVGGTLGLLVGAGLGVAALAVTGSPRPDQPLLLVLAACLVGVSAGALIGLLVVGGHARQAEHEFEELRDHALDEAPVRTEMAPAPTVDAGSTVFDQQR